MNADLKAKWLAALRSGEYKQGRGKLKSEDGEFCCIGVLCEVSPDIEFFVDAAGDSLARSTGSSAEHLFDSEVFGYASLYGPGLDVVGLSDGVQADLINLNDDDLLDFNAIADFIEALDANL